jgi:fucose permease
MMTAVIKGGTSWTVGYIVIVAAYLVLTAAFLLTRSHWSIVQAETATTAATNRGASARSTLRLPIVWLCIGLFFAYAGLESSAGQWSFPLFNEARGVPADLAAFWVSIYWGSFTVGRIFFGFIVNRFKTITMIRVCLGGMLAGGLVYWWSPAAEIGFIGLALFGFTLAPIFALMVTYTQERLGSYHAPNAIGFEIASASGGVGLLPGLAGFLAERNGLGIVPPFILIFSLFMAVMYELMINPRVTLQSAPAPAGD